MTHKNVMLTNIINYPFVKKNVINYLVLFFQGHVSKCLYFFGDCLLIDSQQGMFCSIKVCCQCPTTQVICSVLRRMSPSHICFSLSFSLMLFSVKYMVGQALVGLLMWMVLIIFCNISFRLIHKAHENCWTFNLAGVIWCV